MHSKSALASLLAATLALAGHAQTSDPPMLERPTPMLGDSRVYAVLDPTTMVEQRIEDLRVTQVEAEQISITDQGSSVLAVYDSQWALKQLGERSYAPPIQALKFPLQVGKTWEHHNVSDHHSCGSTRTQLKNEVIGWEDVSVPAGTFSALRIDSSGYWSNRCGSDQARYRFWFSPVVGWLVKSESRLYYGGRVTDGQLRVLKSYQLQPRT